jgi:hypothetical protein
VDNSKLKNDEMLIKVYKPTRIMLFLYWFWGIPFLAIFTFLIWSIFDRNQFDRASVCWLAVISIMQAYLLWYLYTFSFRTRLILYKDGLELQQGSAHFFAAWEHLSHFGGKKIGKAFRVGIYLHKIVQPEVKGILDRFHFGWPSNFLPVTTVILLPRRWLGLFVDTEKLLETEFGRDLLHYAPQVFEVAKEKVKNG